MEWKANARRRPQNAAAFRDRMDGAVTSLVTNPIRMLHGKPLILWTHTRDFVETDDTGKSTVVASMDFRQGEYIFPQAYLHPAKRIVGETKDARFTTRGWVVFLDAVLRDKAGEPVKIDGCEIDMSGWYLESELRDAGLGKQTIRLGATAPTFGDLEASRVARIRKQRELAEME